MKIKQPEMRVTLLAPAAAPAMASNALQVEDEFNAFYMAGTDGAAGHVLRPPYDPRVLERLTQENNVLGACIDAMVVNVAGTGHRIERETKRADEPDEQDDPVACKLEAFFREPFPGTSFLAMRRDLERDMERVGYGALEIMRNPAGEVVFLRNTPARTIRLCKLDAPAPVAKTVSRNGAEISVNVMVRERRFVQLMAGSCCSSRSSARPTSSTSIPASGRAPTGPCRFRRAPPSFFISRWGRTPTVLMACRAGRGRSPQ